MTYQRNIARLFNIMTVSKFPKFSTLRFCRFIFLPAVVALQPTAVVLKLIWLGLLKSLGAKLSLALIAGISRRFLFANSL